MLKCCTCGALELEFSLSRIGELREKLLKFCTFGAGNERKENRGFPLKFHDNSKTKTRKGKFSNSLNS
jgi:hypothetical protein